MLQGQLGHRAHFQRQEGTKLSPDSELEPVSIFFSHHLLTHHFMRKGLRWGWSPGPRLCPELLPPRQSAGLGWQGARAHSGFLLLPFSKE